MMVNGQCSWRNGIKLERKTEKEYFCGINNINNKNLNVSTLTAELVVFIFHCKNIGFWVAK